LMLGKFPTQARVRAWLDRQAEVLNELRLHQDATPDPKHF
jgi:hypothetical protein